MLHVYSNLMLSWRVESVRLSTVADSTTFISGLSSPWLQKASTHQNNLRIRLIQMQDITIYYNILQISIGVSLTFKNELAATHWSTAEFCCDLDEKSKTRSSQTGSGSHSTSTG